MKVFVWYYISPGRTLSLTFLLLFTTDVFIDEGVCVVLLQSWKDAISDLLAVVYHRCVYIAISDLLAVVYHRCVSIAISDLLAVVYQFYRCVYIALEIHNHSYQQ